MSRRAASRVALGVAGAYLFAWSVAGAGAALLFRLGVARSEAVLIASMAAFLVYLGAALWAFVARRLWPVALVLPGAWLLYCGAGYFVDWS
ncbi:iron uptake protein [Janthinobacterium sp.]|uniref:iron uptake protein n=1 Tax=Janthinobacterium sp. TaxID=1871054 RepID=UPI00258C814A|nr:iron uptake protein [Janthinobacterium sp.]MCX7293765.1 iron uptake protein [Janthinobacterium sp.]